MKPRLQCSFSGGATSGMMAKRIKEEKGDEYDIVFIFANTGEENEKTLEFVRRCDEEFALGVVWVEAVSHPDERKGSSHRVVTFETASRNGEPFEAMIEKYGIPNKSFPHCTRELKLNAMSSYMNSIGWTEYTTAIGIRADENRRVDEKAVEHKIIYPLIDWWPADKQDVNEFWEGMPFQLQLQEHEGNCKWCWKKSLHKHLRLISERPWIYDFPRRMESKNGFAGKTDGIKRVFFRENRSTEDLFALAKELDVLPYKPMKDLRSHAARQSGLDFESASCSESCEMFPMVSA